MAEALILDPFGRVGFLVQYVLLSFGRLLIYTQKQVKLDEH